MSKIVICCRNLESWSSSLSQRITPVPKICLQGWELNEISERNLFIFTWNMSTFNKQVPVSRIWRSFSGLDPSVPPNTYKLLLIVTQVWLSRGVGGRPFTLGLLHVCFTAHDKPDVATICHATEAALKEQKLTRSVAIGPGKAYTCAATLFVRASLTNIHVCRNYLPLALCNWLCSNSWPRLLSSVALARVER